jgi:hypothetical protein
MRLSPKSHARLATPKTLTRRGSRPRRLEGPVQRRSVYGEATPDQAKELHEEGVEFHPLPVLPDEWN